MRNRSQRLLIDGTSAIAEPGFGGAEGNMRVVENTPGVHNVIVCTLCSCYPWPVLGLPPNWYKDFAYRSRIVREPRRVLAECGLNLDDNVEIRVWDSSAEIRYMVLPQPPRGADHLSEDELAALVTRDGMIGVAVLRQRGTYRCDGNAVEQRARAIDPKSTRSAPASGPRRPTRR